MSSASTKGLFRRLWRNTAYLLSGKAVGLVLHLAALALAGRALGPEAFGLLVMIHATAKAASGFASSQSWQAVIRYGTAHLLGHRHRQLIDLLAFCLLVDAATGLLAMFAAMAAILLFAHTIGLSPEIAGMAALYCLVVPTMAATTHIGVLRLLDRFDLLAIQTQVNPALRLAGVALAAGLGAPLWSFALAWFAGDLIADLLIAVVALRELKRRGLLQRGDIDPRRAWREQPTLGSFMLATNASASVAVLLGPTSTLLVGALLGPASAALYRICLVLIESGAKPGEMVTRAFLPEIMRLRSVGDMRRFWQLVARVVLVALGAAAAMVVLAMLIGDRVILVIFGSAYGDAGEVLRLASLALLGLLPMLFFDVALVSLGQAGRGLLARCCGAAALFALLVVLVPRVGLAGVGWSYAAAAVITALVAAALLARERLQPPALPVLSRAH